MENYLALSFLPPQTVGEETETSASIESTDENNARLLFEQACEKLKDVNNWKKLCGSLSADFALVDEQGKQINTTIEKGNYIRIDIPGPGTKTGDGYDWVKIENILYEIISPNRSIFLIQARPSKTPSSENDHIAHFLTAQATSSFVITLDGKKVIATVFGRNEVPNTKQVDKFFDKMRNAIIGSTGAIGLSKLQWKALVDGVLRHEI